MPVAGWGESDLAPSHSPLCFSKLARSRAAGGNPLVPVSLAGSGLGGGICRGKSAWSASLTPGTIRTPSLESDLITSSGIRRSCHQRGLLPSHPLSWSVSCARAPAPSWSPSLPQFTCLPFRAGPALLGSWLFSAPVLPVTVTYGLSQVTLSEGLKGLLRLQGRYCMEREILNIIFK